MWDNDEDDLSTQNRRNKRGSSALPPKNWSSE